LPDTCEYKGRFAAALGLTASREQPTIQALGIHLAGVDGDLIYPAQLALLSGELPDTLILNPIQ